MDIQGEGKRERELILTSSGGDISTVDCLEQSYLTPLAHGSGQVSFALLTTEITRDEGPTGASQALGPPPPPPAPPQPGMEESSGVGPVLSSPTLPPHPSAGPCGANTGSLRVCSWAPAVYVCACVNPAPLMTDQLHI